MESYSSKYVERAVQNESYGYLRNLILNNPTLPILAYTEGKFKGVWPEEEGLDAIVESVTLYDGIWYTEAAFSKMVEDEMSTDSAYENVSNEDFWEDYDRFIRDAHFVDVIIILY